MQEEATRIKVGYLLLRESDDSIESLHTERTEQVPFGMHLQRIKHVGANKHFDASRLQEIALEAYQHGMLTPNSVLSYARPHGYTPLKGGLTH